MMFIRIERSLAGKRIAILEISGDFSRTFPFVGALIAGLGICLFAGAHISSSYVGQGVERAERDRRHIEMMRRLIEAILRMPTSHCPTI